MIESANTNELQGQLELGDLVNREKEMPEGYDAEGHLLNMDYPSVAGGGTTASDPPQAAAPLNGKAFGEDATPKESLPQRPEGAVQGKVDFPENACIVPGKTEEVAIPDAIPDAGASGEAGLSPQGQADDEERLTALATEINAITEQTRGVVISAALAVGRRLIEARSLCREGRWLEWLSKSVSYSERKAQDMMRLYTEYGRDGAIPESIAAMDYSKAVALLSAPAEAREALAEKAQAEDLSVRALQQEVRRLNAEKAKAQTRIEGLEQQIDTAQGHIDRLTDEGNRQDAAIVDRDREIEKKEEELKEARRVLAVAEQMISVADARTAAAESAAEQLKRLRAEAEDRADQNAQRYGDALNRANQTAKDLAEARAKIQALSEAAAAAVPEPERVEVEVIPEETRREIEQLKRELAEARAVAQGTGNTKGTGMAEASATEKFKWFYQNQMQPVFKTALSILQEAAREDGHAADLIATVLNNACKTMMNQLGTKEA